MPVGKSVVEGFNTTFLHLGEIVDLEIHGDDRGVVGEDDGTIVRLQNEAASLSSAGMGDVFYLVDVFDTSIYRFPDMPIGKSTVEGFNITFLHLGEIVDLEIHGDDRGVVGEDDVCADARFEGNIFISNMK
ncbi:unnamed protein product [Fraxinus pennsylvanica]|uniref:Uncharacterized protein n=1 Tax=Fraxinus pennsylvanica TaxID=56036 RepID=A0AAD2DLG0_9LAMI|nr:unnamed protein product [Fraxinus pennsylvanica]